MRYVLILLIFFLMGCVTDFKQTSSEVSNNKFETDTTIVYAEESADVVEKTVVFTEKSEIGTEHDVPSWYLIPPSADNLIYSVGYGKMSNMQNSLKMAEMDARGDMTRKIDGTYNDLMKSVFEGYSRKERTAEGEINISSLTQSLSNYGSFQASSYLRGTKRENVYIDKDGGCYVLMSMPVSNVYAWFSEILDNVGVPSDVSADLENIFSNLLDSSL